MQEAKPAVSKASGYLKVYLYRGFIGLPKSVREHAKCLGLTKRFQTVYIPAAAPAVGNLLKIKELVKVQHVPEIPVPRKPMYPRGYTVLSSYLPAGHQ